MKATSQVQRPVWVSIATTVIATTAAARSNRDTEGGMPSRWPTAGLVSRLVPIPIFTDAVIRVCRLRYNSLAFCGDVPHGECGEALGEIVVGEPL